jgi:hypothetical protein
MSNPNQSYWTRCGYEVPGMIFLLLSHLYSYRLLNALTFEVLPLKSYAITLNNVATVGTFMKLLWNLFQRRRHVFECYQNPEIFIPLRQTLLLETPEVVFHLQ